MVRSDLPIFNDEYCGLRVRFNDSVDYCSLVLIENCNGYRAWYMDDEREYIILTPTNSMVNNRSKWNRAVDKEIITQNRLCQLDLYCCEANKAEIEIDDGNMTTLMKTIVCRSEHYINDQYGLTPYYPGLECESFDTYVLEYQLSELVNSDIRVDADHSAVRNGGTIVYYRPPCLQFTNGKQKKNRFTEDSVTIAVDRIRGNYMS